MNAQMFGRLLFVVAITTCLVGCTIYTPLKNGGVAQVDVSEGMANAILEGMFAPTPDAPPPPPPPQPEFVRIDFGPGALVAYSYVDYWSPGTAMCNGAFAIYSDHFEFKSPSFQTRIPFQIIRKITHANDFVRGRYITVTTNQGRFRFNFTVDNISQVAQRLRQAAQK